MHLLQTSPQPIFRGCGEFGLQNYIGLPKVWPMRRTVGHTTTHEQEDTIRPCVLVLSNLKIQPQVLPVVPRTAPLVPAKEKLSPVNIYLVSRCVAARWAKGIFQLSDSVLCLRSLASGSTGAPRTSFEITQPGRWCCTCTRSLISANKNHECLVP